MEFRPLSLLGGLAALASVPSYAQIDGMSLVWADEFDYTGLPDATKWAYDVGGAGWGNNERQYYTEDRLENARVENGMLIIEAIKETFSRSNEYTSARLVSTGEGNWLYGRFEIRAKLPRGRGTWPAIWMLPTDWVYGGWPSSGEIDIMEHVGYDMNRIHGTVHTEDYNHVLGTQVGTNIVADNVDTEFHLYSLEWRPNRIDVFLDDRLYFSFQNEKNGYATWPFDQRFHLLLNIAIGGNWGGVKGVDDTIFPQRMEVDYVRVYAFDDLSTEIVHAVPGKLEAEDFNAQLGVRTEATSDSGGGLNLGYLADGDWMDYTIHVTHPGRYALDVRYASPHGTAGIIVTPEGQSSETTLLTTATGGWQNWATTTAGEYHLDGGDLTLHIEMEVPGDEDLNLNWFELRLVEADTWAGYPISATDGPYVDTGDFLGWLAIKDAPWVFSFALEKWMYLREESVRETGAWMFVTNE